MRIGQLVVDALVDESQLLKTLFDQTDQTDPTGQTDQTDQTDQTTTDDLAELVGLPGVVKQSTYLLKYYIDDKQHGIKQAAFNHGVPSLDILLASAHYLGLDQCMQQIAECCADMSKLCSPDQSRLDVQVAKQVFDSPMVPCLTLDWPGMESLVKLCQVMPSILRLNMIGLFFNKLVGKIDCLYCSQHQPCVMLSKTDEKYTRHWLAFDALVGRHAYKFVCTNNNNNTVTKLFKLEMHQTHQTNCTDGFDNVCLLDTTVITGSVRNGLMVSPDQQYILWCCVSDGLGFARVYKHVTHQLATGQAMADQLVLRLPGVRKASWLGQRLAVWTNNSPAWHCVDLDGKTLFSMPGNFAACTDTMVVSTSQINLPDQCMTAIWVLQAPSNQPIQPIQPNQPNQQLRKWLSWHKVVNNEWQVQCSEWLCRNSFVFYNKTKKMHRLVTLDNNSVTFGSAAMTGLESTRASAKLVWTNPCIASKQTNKPTIQQTNKPTNQQTNKPTNHNSC